MDILGKFHDDFMLEQNRQMHTKAIKSETVPFDLINEETHSGFGDCSLQMIRRK